MLVCLTTVLRFLKASANALVPLNVPTLLRSTVRTVVVNVPTTPLQCGFSPPKLGPTPPIKTLVVPLINPSLPIPILPKTSVPMVLTSLRRRVLIIGITTARSGRCIPTPIPWCKVSITEDILRVTRTCLLRLPLTTVLP